MRIFRRKVTAKNWGRRSTYVYLGKRVLEYETRADLSKQRHLASIARRPNVAN